MIPKLSRLGFGVSGAHGTPLVPARETIAMIERAAELGITFFDTAPAYGAGEAERRLGRALKGLDRDRLFVTTKAGLTSHGLTGRRRDFSPDAVEASLRASLARLDVEGVDGFLLHGPVRGQLNRDIMRRLKDLKAAGAFKFLGAAGRGGELDGVLRRRRFELIMTPVHPWIGEEAEDRLARAAEAGVHVIAIETAGGAPPPMRPPCRLSDLYALAKAVRGPYARGFEMRRLPVAEGLREALRHPAVASGLMTTTRPAHLEENVRSVLSAADGPGSYQL